MLLLALVRGTSNLCHCRSHLRNAACDEDEAYHQCDSIFGSDVSFRIAMKLLKPPSWLSLAHLQLPAANGNLRHWRRNEQLRCVNKLLRSTHSSKHSSGMPGAFVWTQTSSAPGARGLHSSPLVCCSEQSGRSSGASAISSVNNDYIKHCVKLRDSSRYRHEERRVLVVGRVPLEEIAGERSSKNYSFCIVLTAGRSLCHHMVLLRTYWCFFDPFSYHERMSLSLYSAQRLPAHSSHHQAALYSYLHVALLYSHDREQYHIPLVSGAGGTISVETAIVPEGGSCPGFVRAKRCIHVTEPVLRKLSGLENVSSLEVVAEMPMPPLQRFESPSSPAADAAATTVGASRGADHASCSSAGQTEASSSSAVGTRQLQRLLALEGVQDPGNLGTLMRTAIAFGWDGVFLLPGCCDPFNDKAVRASRGGVFRLPMASGSWRQLEQAAGEHRLVLLAAEPPDDKVAAVGTGSSVASSSRSTSGSSDAAAAQGHASSSAGGLPEREAARPGGASSQRQRGLVLNVGGRERGVCLVLGSEGQGLSQHALTVCAPVGIPMAGQMESLNVGIAGGILMFALSSGVASLLQELTAQLHPEHDCEV